MLLYATMRTGQQDKHLLTDPSLPLHSLMYFVYSSSLEDVIIFDYALDKSKETDDPSLQVILLLSFKEQTQRRKQ